MDREETREDGGYFIAGFSEGKIGLLDRRLNFVKGMLVIISHPNTHTHTHAHTHALARIPHTHNTQVYTQTYI